MLSGRHETYMHDYLSLRSSMFRMFFDMISIFFYYKLFVEIPLWLFSSYHLHLTRESIESMCDSKEWNDENAPAARAPSQVCVCVFQRD